VFCTFEEMQMVVISIPVIQRYQSLARRRSRGRYQEGSGSNVAASGMGAITRLFCITVMQGITSPVAPFMVGRMLF
jgi:hypothetical protein